MVKDKISAAVPLKEKKMANKKAEMFNALMEGGPEGVFVIQEGKDEVNSLIYQSKLVVNGKEKFFMIVFDDTDSTVVSFLIDDENITAQNYGYVLEFCNERNSMNRLMRYYVDRENHLLMDCCVAAREQFFDAELLANVIDTMAEELADAEEALGKALRCE